MSAEPPIPRVFICYARADNESADRRERWLDRLRQHLRPYETQGEIEVFVDSIIELGADWHEEIQGQLRAARVVVLLVSSAFLASSYVGSSELPVLLQRAREDGIKIIPVIVSPCGFDEVVFRYPDPKTGPERKKLSSLQAANSPKETLYQLGYGEQERVLTEVAKAVRRFALAPASRPEPVAAKPPPAAFPASLTPRSAAIAQPSSAQRVWQDRFGLAAEFTLRGVAFVLRWVPPGRFVMGSPAGEQGRYPDEGPQHEVTITRGFWLGEVPVTQGQWGVLGGENPSRFKGEDRPVEQVSWDDCQGWLGRLNGAVAGLGARLPTEAEWEYACRAGTEGAYQDGSACTRPEGKDPALERLGWYAENSGRETRPVKGKLANAWGLYDLHGNVWEWCADGRRDYTSAAQRDPVGPLEATPRVVRGGAWFSRAQFCRAAYRILWGPDSRRDLLGFRLAAGPEPGAAEPPGPEG